MVNWLRCIFFLFSSLQPAFVAHGQAIPDTSTARQQIMAEVGGIASSATQTPFWLRSRQYGIVPLTGPAGIVRVGLMKQYGDPQNLGKTHFKVAVEGVANLGSPSRVILPVAYASLLLKNFELYAGRRREVFGLVDTLLSSGSYAWSGNALPLYKIQFGTRGYWPIGFTKGVLAINALYAHGWFSSTDSVQNSFLHQKALFARISLFKNRVRLYGGVTHHAQWGGYSNVIGGLAPHGRIPGSFQDYLNVVLVRDAARDTAVYSEFDLVNKVGNHLGSIDFALETDNPKFNWYLYYQHPYEDKSGVVFKNMPDGLYGIRWKARQLTTAINFRIIQITAEFLTTLDQSGFNIDIGNRLYQGADDYFNNYQFVDGWTHRQHVIGTPFLTRWSDSRSDLHNLKGGLDPMMISNNRVQVIHLGLFGQWPSGAKLRTLLSYSRNYGRPIIQDSRLPLSQFSGMTELTFPVQWFENTYVRTTLVIDQGQWLTDNIGGWLSIKKIFTNK